MIKISVITPSYNQADYIRATLDSVLKQDYPNIEHFVVDGGSTDGTVEILKSYSDPRLKWVSERDKGQPDALNKGVAETTGELITFINSDDLLLPGTLSFAANYFADHPEIDIIYGDGYYVDAAGNRLKSFKSKTFDLQQAVLGGQEWAQPGTFWRRRVTEKVSVFDIHLHYRFDMDFMLRAAFAGFSLEYLPGERAVYRLHDQSKTVSQIDRFLDDWHQIIDKVYARNDLPKTIENLRPAVEDYLKWHDAKRAWLHNDFNKARPALKSFLSAGSMGRRGLAATMLIDSYLHTPLTKIASTAFERFTGANTMTP